MGRTGTSPWEERGGAGAIGAGGGDSNPHDFHHRNLNPARLPVPPRPRARRTPARRFAVLTTRIALYNNGVGVRSKKVRAAARAFGGRMAWDRRRFCRASAWGAIATTLAPAAFADPVAAVRQLRAVGGRARHVAPERRQDADGDLGLRRHRARPAVADQAGRGGQGPPCQQTGAADLDFVAWRAHRQCDGRRRRADPAAGRARCRLRLSLHAARRRALLVPSPRLSAERRADRPRPLRRPHRRRARPAEGRPGSPSRPRRLVARCERPDRRRLSRSRPGDRRRPDRPARHRQFTGGADRARGAPRRAAPGARAQRLLGADRARRLRRRAADGHRPRRAAERDLPSRP